MRYVIAALFASAGLCLGSVNVWNNAVAINGGTFIWNDLTLLVAGLAICSAMISLVISHVAAQNRALGLLCIALVCGTTFVSVGYTLGRVGGVADHGAAHAIAHNARIDRATAAVASLDAERTAEAKRGGCGRQCKAIISRLDAAQSALNSLGARQVVDPAGERLDSFTGGWLSVHRYRVSHPVVTAISLELGVALLLAIAGLFGAPVRRTGPTIIDITPVRVDHDPVIALLQQGPVASNQELARRLGCSEATASRRVRELSQQRKIHTRMIGKSKYICAA